MTDHLTRRDFLQRAAAALVFPAAVRSPQSVPRIDNGIQIGDPLADRALVWARSDRPSRLLVEYATTESFIDPRRAKGPVATAASDFTARADLKGLKAGQTYFVRVRFEDRDGRTLSEPALGRFRTPSKDPREIRFLWSGDTVGQGYGINPDLGGMRIYETMRALDPDFFIHSGDTIYADGPVQSEVRLPGGAVWKNITTEAKSKVAETLDEFRGAYLYNLMDENVRKFNASVPQIWQWDDHEVSNNWSPGLNLSANERYKVHDLPTLVERSRQAFFEYSPMRFQSRSPRVYRRIPYGPLLDIFVLDLRSYRAANSFNLQTAESAETTLLGAAQMQWLKRDLKNSRAVWKVIASDMPVGLVVPDGRDAQDRPRFEASSNANGPPAGREFETAKLLSFMKKERVRNVIWLTADVHYTAAHFYDPARAQFSDFDPFWEFVSGPLNAGVFGPNAIDNTFGLQVVFQKTGPSGVNPDRSPRTGLQFFGEVLIDERTRDLTVNLRDLTGTPLFTKTLNPVAASL
jgi:alkaline phosphatase D